MANGNCTCKKEKGLNTTERGVEHQCKKAHDARQNPSKSFIYLNAYAVLTPLLIYNRIDREIEIAARQKSTPAFVPRLHKCFKPSTSLSLDFVFHLHSQLLYVCFHTYIYIYMFIIFFHTKFSMHNRANKRTHLTANCNVYQNSTEK